MKTLQFFLAVLAVLAFQNAYSQGTYKLQKEIPVNGDGSWDYLALDPNMAHLFISHGNMVQVMDLNTEKLIGVIPNTKGAHGIALVPESGKGYITAGKIDSVIVFDCNTLQVLKKIKAGQNPDAVIYDPVSKRVFSFNKNSKDATAIDILKDEVAGTITLPGKPGSATSDGTGKVFVNIEDKGVIVKFDAKTLKLEAEWPLEPGKEPAGLAFDSKTNRLFSACNGSKQVIVMDAATGKVVAKCPVGEGCDGLIFTPQTREIFTSNEDGTMTVIRQKDADTYEVKQTVQTKKSARTFAFDPSKRKFYLPVADVKIEDGKQVIVPGSFKILVVSQSPNRINRP